jgi:ABC-type glycerol-3-phosphate transport system permease component
MRKSLNQLPIHLVLILLALISTTPLYFMLITAFKSKADFLENRFGLPRRLSLEHLSWLLEHGLVRQLGNTILLTFLACLIGITLGTLAAFAFARMRFPGQTMLFNGTIALLALPGIIVIIPLYATMAKLGLLNSYQCLSQPC